MVSRKSAIMILVIFLLLLIPMFTQKTQALLTVEETNYPNIDITWFYTPLLYDNQYHNTTALWEEIDNFEVVTSDIIDVEVIGNSYYGKEIKAVKITNELRTHEKAKTLVVANHHGREQISVEVALRFIQRLVNQYGHSHSISERIDNQEIYVIPTLNPDALDLVVNEGENMLRKNARPYDDDLDGSADEDPLDDLNGDGIISWYIVYEKNGTELIYLSHTFEGEDNDLDGLVNEDILGHVDLNRNYATFFRDGRAWSEDSQAGNYPGETPFSEPETQAFRDFAEQHRFAMAYSLHSGTNATYFAKHSHDFYEPDLAWAMYSDFQDILPDYTFHTNANFEPPEADPWNIAGIWENWMYFERATLMPLTLELYGNSSAFPIPYVTEIPIVDNSTHFITEWKGINNFYVPEEPYINHLWNDVQPAFDYLLENTPSLDVSAVLSSEEDLPGSSVDLYINCINYSPHLSSVTSVDVFDITGTKICDGMVVLNDIAALIHAEFDLPSTFDGTYEIKIGNDYTGYYHFTLVSDTTSTSTGVSSVTETGFSALGVIVVSIGVTAYFIRIRKQNKH